MWSQQTNQQNSINWGFFYVCLSLAHAIRSNRIENKALKTTKKMKLTGKNPVI